MLQFMMPRVIHQNYLSIFQLMDLKEKNACMGS